MRHYHTGNIKYCTAGFDCRGPLLRGLRCEGNLSRCLSGRHLGRHRPSASGAASLCRYLSSTIGRLGHQNKPTAPFSEQRPEARADELDVFQNDLSQRNLRPKHLDIELNGSGTREPGNRAPHTNKPLPNMIHGTPDYNFQINRPAGRRNKILIKFKVFYFVFKIMT